MTRETEQEAIKRKPLLDTNYTPQTMQFTKLPMKGDVFLLCEVPLGQAPCGSAVYGKVDEMSPAPPLAWTPLPLAWTPLPGPPWKRFALMTEDLCLHDLWKTRRTRKNRRHYRQETSHCSCLEHCFLFSLHLRHTAQVFFLLFLFAVDFDPSRTPPRVDGTRFSHFDVPVSMAEAAKSHSTHTLQIPFGQGNATRKTRLQKQDADCNEHFSDCTARPE